MVNPKHSAFTTTLDFIKENYGHYQLSFFQLQNNKLVFLYGDEVGYIKAEISSESLIYMSPQINFNTPDIKWEYIEVYLNADDNVTASWVSPNYKWS
jgi:hypothetical protein